MEITYKDEDGEFINVSDDEDLRAAYEVAESSMNGQINFFVKPRLMVQPKTENEVPKDENTSNSIGETMPQDNTKGKRRERKPKREKDATPAYQKRAFKKLIKKELNKQCDKIFSDLFNMPEYSEDKKAIDKFENPEWVASLAQHIGSTVRSQFKNNQGLIDSLKNSLDEVNAAEKAIKDQLKENKA